MKTTVRKRHPLRKLQCPHLFLLLPTRSSSGKTTTRKVSRSVASRWGFGAHNPLSGQRNVPNHVSLFHLQLPSLCLPPQPQTSTWSPPSLGRRFLPAKCKSTCESGSWTPAGWSSGIGPSGRNRAMMKSMPQVSPVGLHVLF